MIDYDRILAFVKEKHAGHPFAGIDHVERVHDICMKLAEGLQVDMEVLRIAAYLHDIAVPVFGPAKHNEQAAEVAADLLNELGVTADKQKRIFAAIRTHTRYMETEPDSLEAQILKDADGVDYLGAIGIMRGVIRSFRNKSYSGNVTLEGKKVVEDLINKVEVTFSTAKGQEMANERIRYIKTFMKRLDEELEIG